MASPTSHHETASHPAHVALLDVVEVLNTEQLALVARWLTLESDYFEHHCQIPSILPDLSELLRLCAKSKSQVSYTWLAKQREVSEPG